MRVFGRPFRIRVLRGELGCHRVRRIASRRCALYLNRQWSCLSYREARPFIAWMPSDELFRIRPSPEIVFKRYPCRRARVTPSLFATRGMAFPTRRQMLADDVVRCRMLSGRAPAAVIAAIGPPDERSGDHQRGAFLYWLGPERDSIVQIDDEALLIEFRGGRARTATIVQG